MPYKPIESYGIIGNLDTVALVAKDGSIDFFCAPQFDSPTVFAALLDDEKGGFFKIAPDFKMARTTQLYVPDTNVLLTRFMSHEGILEVTDFMPVTDRRRTPGRIIRICRAIRGTVPVTMECKPAFGYATNDFKSTIEDDGASALLEGQGGSSAQHFWLQCTVPMTFDDHHITAHVELKTGEWFCVALTYDDGKMDGFCQDRILEIEKETIHYWRAWLSQSIYEGRWRDMVHRSALTLKLLTSRQYGSIVASPTFGLPEAVGGARNWDYRYCWIRDSAFTVHAMLQMGFKEEALNFHHWVEKLYKTGADDDGSLQIMYRIDGTPNIEEQTLDHLKGYENSKPVRIGNAAYKQFQLDIYGEMMDAIYLGNKYITKISFDAWQHVTKSIDYVCKNWRIPDAGIWEFRGDKVEFLHSRLMCWVAIDRAIRLARAESLPAKFIEWDGVRSEIYDSIFRDFWNDKMGCFVQYKGATAVDASVLLMPMVQFIGPKDPRWLSTLDRVGELLATDALVYRYRQDDLTLSDIDASREGSFNACSFWYIECLAKAGRMDEAHLLFDKMIGYANHLGLFAEEIGDDGRQLGNFPQAFTHLALISAVYALERPDRHVQERY